MKIQFETKLLKKQYKEIKKEQKRLSKLMSNKRKHKIEIPEGYRVNREFTTQNVNEIQSITIVLEPIEKPLPKTWEEYCELMSINPKIEITLGHYSNGSFFDGSIDSFWTALYKLIELRDHYNDGWVPDWNYHDPKHCIIINYNKSELITYVYRSAILAFKTHELRKEFLSNFRSLIEQAKPLL